MDNRPLTLLLLEDDPSVQKLISLLLEPFQLRVIAKRTLEEAYAIQMQDLDIAVIDYTLPDGSGIGFAERILAERPAVPVIITTGFLPHHLPMPEEVRSRVLFLEKPFSVQQLRNLISLALNRDLA